MRRLVVSGWVGLAQKDLPKFLVFLARLASESVDDFADVGGNLLVVEPVDGKRIARQERQ